MTISALTLNSKWDSLQKDRNNSLALSFLLVLIKHNKKVFHALDKYVAIQPPLEYVC